MLTQYEVDRLARLAINAARCREIGLIDTVAEFAELNKVKPRNPRVKSAPSLPAAPPRRSIRVSVKVMDLRPDDAAEDSEDDDDAGGQAIEETSSWGSHLRKTLRPLYLGQVQGLEAAVDSIGRWLDACGYSYSVVSNHTVKLREDDSLWKREEHGMRPADLSLVQGLCAKVATGG